MLEMNIDQFVTQFSGESKGIDDVLRQWQFDELDELVGTLQSQHDQFVGAAVIVGDAVYGGTLLDQISPELQQAFVNLMGKRADTYSAMRKILLDHSCHGDGAFRAFDDPHVVGFVNKIKGQIGENLFQHHVGSAAILAESGSQEAWDVAVKQADGLHHYVQVKLYADPHKVVRHMVKVHQRVLDGGLAGVDQETVSHVYFAVPENIKDDVQRLVAGHDGLSDMLYDKTIPISAHDAAGLVSEGISNVGPDQLSHFFYELLGGAVAAGSLHTVVNGFLWYKGSKDFSAAFADAMASTAISTSGIAMGLIAETLCNSVIFSGAVGVGGRFFLGRMAKSRWSFAEFLEASTDRCLKAGLAVNRFNNGPCLSG
jgi:hypothetical protein